MTYDRKTMKLTSAGRLAIIAYSTLIELRAELDHDAETYEMAKEAMELMDRMCILKGRILRMLNDYALEQVEG